MKENRAELYFITSIYLNAYLLSKGFEVDKTAKLNSGKVALFYKKSDELFEAIDEYKANRELSEFVNSYLQVKSIMQLHRQKEVVEDLLDFD